MDSDWQAVEEGLDPETADYLSAVLRNVGIPAQVVTETAGATLMVPAGHFADARLLLQNTRRPAPAAVVLDDEDDDPADEDDLDWFNKLSRSMMVVAAAAFSPVGLVLGVIAGWLTGRDKK